MPGFALGIRYLTGYSVATDSANRESAEWPPHPGRVFMALAAAHFETGEDPAERAALEWLEALECPRLQVSDADRRSVVTSFVPVNDTAGPSKASLQSAPQFTRDRAARNFPCVRPHHDTLFLVWPDIVLDARKREALESVCAKVVRVGHSTSLVQMWCGELPTDCQSTLEPTDGTAHVRVRVASSGALGYLRRQYNREAIESFARLSETITSQRGKTRDDAKAEFKRMFGIDWKKSLTAPVSRRPVLGLWQGYRRVVSEMTPRPEGSVFDPALVVLRLEPVSSSYQKLDLATTLRLTEVLRKAVQYVADRDLGLDSIPEVLTGHKPAGESTDRPHVAYLPLAFVGDTHSTGHLMGLAVALPREEHWPDHRKERRLVMAVLSRISDLTLGQLGVWNLKPELRETPPLNLLPDTWTAWPSGSHLWASVTPVVFDEHPKDRDRDAYHEAVTAMIRRACVRAGLPEPVAVQITPVSKHLGCPSAREFPRLVRKDGGERRHTHVTIEFREGVVGPVLLGAGRYRGYGLCRPVRRNVGGGA